jgi:hypothetical protein
VVTVVSVTVTVETVVTVQATVLAVVTVVTVKWRWNDSCSGQWRQWMVTVVVTVATVSGGDSVTVTQWTQW